VNNPSSQRGVKRGNRMNGDRPSLITPIAVCVYLVAELARFVRQPARLCNGLEVHFQRNMKERRPALSISHNRSPSLCKPHGHAQPALTGWPAQWP
jgi:hypothetical protein